jgi:hypothetical protein
MTSINTSDLGLPEPPARPNVAIVMIRRPGTGPVGKALERLAEVARLYGIEVLALLPARAGEAVTGVPPFSVRVIPIDDDRPGAAWRARALAETAADIIEFVDEEQVDAVPWDDVFPRRVGLVRLDREAEPDLRERLVRLGVAAPERGQDGHA